MSDIVAFGADPTGIFDSTAAIQLALNAGGYVTGSGTFKVSAGLSITRPTRIAGHGQDLVFNVTPAFSGSSLFNVSPNPAMGCDGFDFMDFAVHPAGVAPAISIINFSTTLAGQFIRKPLIRGLVLSPFGAQCIVSNNSNADGLVMPVISENVLSGGILLNGVGDSLTVEKNIICGSGVGIFASFASSASNCSIRHNNISNVGGSVQLINTFSYTISDNEFEQNNGYSGGVDSMVYLANCNIGDIKNNQMQSNGQCGNIRLDSCYRTVVDRNRLYTVAGHKHVFFNGGTSNTRPDNQYIDCGTNTEVSGYF